MDWIACILCAFPFWGAILLYWITNWLQKRRYLAYLRSDHFVFVKTKEGDLIRKGLSSRNWLALFFLGSLELVSLLVIYQGLRSDAVSWVVVVILTLLAAFVGWLIVYFIRLGMVSPIYFDTQLEEIRFKDQNGENHIPFSDVGQITVTHAGPKPEDIEKALRSTYTIGLLIKSVEKTLVLARITGRSMDRNTQQKDALVELIDSVIKVDERETIAPQAQISEKTAKPSIPVESLIVQNIHKIQELGGANNFVIFTADAEANYYIQLAGGIADQTIYAEAASNQVIQKEYHLSTAQDHAIKALGWQNPSDDELNYHRTWQANSHRERLEIANEIMQTFVDGYGFQANQPLKVEVKLE